MFRWLLATGLSASVLACAAQARAQAVQLPTFRSFGVQTTVSVPDRGSATLGGINRAQAGGTSRGWGPLRNRASGASLGASTVSAQATIIDHRELDAAVLAEARRLREGRASASPLEQRPDPAVVQRVEMWSRHVARSAGEARSAMPASALSVGEIRARAATQKQARRDQAAEKLAAGIKAEAAGKLASARGYYETALRSEDLDIRAEARDRLAKIALPEVKSSQVAHGLRP